MEHIDIHGFGKEPQSVLPGLLHGVVDKIWAEEYFALNITPDGSKCNDLPQILKDVIYVNMNNERAICKFFIQTFIMDKKLNTHPYQHHSATKDYI